MKKVIVSAVLAVIGCTPSDPDVGERGPINLDYLWSAWESTEYHPDRDSRYKPERGSRVGGIIVERFHVDSFPENPVGSEPYPIIDRSVDQYFCREVTSDTCYQFDEIAGVLNEPKDSVLKYHFLALIKDDRPIWRLTDSILIVKNGSTPYSMKPSRRVLVDTSKGTRVVEWP